MRSQTITGAITGTITDASGSVVPNIKVTATNVGTNLAYEATTTDAGVYNLLFLPVGDYSLGIVATGFKKVSLAPFKLDVNQIARVDVKLEVGDTTQTVEVTAAAPTLQTESTATGDTLNSAKLTSIPLNGRNFATLTMLIPGAISTDPRQMNTSARFQGSGSRPQVNGNREQTNNFLLDGVDVNDSIDNRIGYEPNVDALEEVKVLTGNGGGEFGNVGGGSVMMTIRSGTNQYHGNVFEFLRNDKLDANGFFPNKSNTPRNAFRRNIFGGTFGGPIKRDRAFFFIDYEGTEQRGSGPATASVAPPAWRTGDLSQFLTVNKQVVKDPLTGSDLNSRTPFPGNIIPVNRITDPVALKLFTSPTLYPLPNNSGTGALGVTSNYKAAQRSKITNHQGDAKADWRITDKDNLSARWSIGRYELLGSQAALPVQMTGGTTGPTTSAVLSWNRTFSPRFINDARLGYSRVGIDDNVLDWSGLLGADGNQQFGISGGQFIPGLSSVTVGGGLSSVGSAATIGSTVDNKYQFQDSATYIVGTHVLKMGGQILRMQQNRYYAGNNGALGSFGFSGGYSGIDFGDFLLNTLSTKGRGAVVGKWGHRQWRNALYFQDDWKALRNLTLNLGLRWECATPIYEVADRQVNINTYTGALIYPGKTEYGRALYNPYWKQFMPNVGFAWTPDLFHNKLVARGGYRFSSFLEGTGANLRLPLNPPYFTESNITFDARTPGDIRTGFSDVIAAGDLTSPRTGPNPFYQARAWDLNLRPQFTSQYNFALEYQVTATASVTAAYVGQHGTHLVVPHEANQPLPGTGAFSTWAPLNDRRPLATVLPNVGNTALTDAAGTMKYNSLQLSGRKRMSAGLEFVANYTFSKTLTDNLGYYGCGGTNNEGAYWQNAYDRHGNYGPACFDATHNISLGGVYQLPFGKGQKWGSGLNKVTDLLLGGWNINAFSNAHSGFPVTIQASAQTVNTGQMVRGTARANRYRTLNVPSQTVDRFFGPVDSTTFCASGVDNGTCAYGVPALGHFGNTGVGTERAPSYFDLDASVGKKFSLTERQYIDFRAEFFNLLNHVSFGPPGRDISSPAAFGQIVTQITLPRNIQFGLKYYF
jgi:hypothetical protein